MQANLIDSSLLGQYKNFYLPFQLLISQNPHLHTSTQKKLPDFAREGCAWNIKVLVTAQHVIWDTEEQ
jgi:hypothetical protein